MNIINFEPKMVWEEKSEKWILTVADYRHIVSKKENDFDSFYVLSGHYSGHICSGTLPVGVALSLAEEMIFSKILRTLKIDEKNLEKIMNFANVVSKKLERSIEFQFENKFYFEDEDEDSRS